MVIRDPSKHNDVDSIFNQARQAGAVEGSDDYFRPSSSSTRSFTGTARLLSGETVAPAPPPPPEVVTHNVTFWRNGFTVDDGPLRRLDDPANASFLEVITMHNLLYKEYVVILASVHNTHAFSCLMN